MFGNSASEARTKDLLEAAIGRAKEMGVLTIPEVFVDGGSENLNGHLDQLVSKNLIQRTVAQIDVEFSNSMIEALFSRLKHRYLFTIPLTNLESLVKAVDFYLNETNRQIPHSALGGATPEEMMTGKWDDEMVAAMKARILVARQNRLEANRSMKCLPCLA